MTMPTIINEKVHGIIDYAVVVFLLLSPTLFGFTGTIAIITYALAGIHFALTAITDSPMGIIKVLPLTIHGYVEVAAAVAIMLAPWIFGFTEDATGRWFYILLGFAIFVTWLLTAYRPAEAS